MACSRPPRTSSQLLALIVVVGSCVESGKEEVPAAQRVGQGEGEGERTVVYLSRILRTADGDETVIEEEGDLEDGIAEQIARPWTFRGEPYIYQEEAWELPSADGTVEHGYRITRMAREEDDDTETSELPEVDPDVLELIASDPSEEMIEIHLRLRDFPEWDVPPRPTTMLAAAVDIEEAHARRSAALADRQVLAEEMAAGVAYEIASAGGNVVAVRGSSGWVWAVMPQSAIAALTQRPDLARVRRADDIITPAAWRQGDGRSSSRMNADTFIVDGFDGSIANPNRHPFGRLVAAVIEGYGVDGEDPPVETCSGFEDDACGFYDGANCTGSNRILARYKCDSGGANPCHSIIGFASNEKGNHGTAVAGAILADYSDDQGCGHALNDAGWSSGCHTTDWEDSATGMAPEALLEYFAAWGAGWSGSQNASLADALHFAYTYGEADVINASWGDNTSCDHDPDTEIQDEVENAFDDGALVVAAAGNANGPSSACNIWGPASYVKALAVNAFDALDPSACQTDYHSWCLVDSVTSAKGGMAANVAGTLRANALTGIGLIAPNEVIRYTSNLGNPGIGDYGYPTNNTTAQGTSYAAPTVAGLALLVKHRMLNYGSTWINSPGRLQTVMLAMGDRHYSTSPTSKTTATVQRTTRGDSLYGFGRPTLRKFLGATEAPTSAHIVTWSTRTASHTYFPFGLLPSGTALVKCVLHQHEDLSSTSTIANFDLRLRVLQPVGGNCDSTGTQLGSREDNSYDAKSMAEFESTGGLSLSGKCPEVRINPVAADRVTSTNVFCYYSGLQDDE